MMKLKSIFAILAAGVLACTGLTACGDAASSGEKKTIFKSIMPAGTFPCRQAFYNVV